MGLIVGNKEQRVEDKEGENCTGLIVHHFVTKVTTLVLGWSLVFNC